MSEEALSKFEQMIRYNAGMPFEQKKAIPFCTEHGKPVMCNLAEDFPSFLVGGQSGYGKTSAVAYLCCQIVMCGGRLLVLDPHCNAPRDSLAKIIEPLSPWFVRPVLDFSEADSSEIMDYFQFMLDEFEVRKRPHGTIGKQPLFFVIDEWAELLDSLEDDEMELAIKAVRTIARGARKYQMWVCLISQSWNLEATGGSQIRKNIPGRIAFSAEMADLRMTLDTRDTRTLSQLCIPPLGKGHAIMKRSGIGIHRVRFIYTEKRNCADVATLMRKVFGFSAQGGTFSEKPKDFSAENTTLEPSRSSKPVFRELTGSVRVSRKEWEEIVSVGTKMLQETGKVTRTKIRDELGYTAEEYEKIKAVCDALGWTYRMKKDGEMTSVQWEALKAEADYRCAKCGKVTDLEADHIMPEIKGGSNAVENRQPLCRGCNASKGIQTVDYR